MIQGTCNTPLFINCEKQMLFKDFEPTLSGCSVSTNPSLRPQGILIAQQQSNKSHKNQPKSISS